MNGAEQFVQADIVFHRQHEFSKQFSSMFANDRHAENPVFARLGQHFNKAMRLHRRQWHDPDRLGDKC